MIASTIISVLLLGGTMALTAPAQVNDLNIEDVRLHRRLATSKDLHMDVSAGHEHEMFHAWIHADAIIRRPATGELASALGKLPLNAQVLGFANAMWHSPETAHVEIEKVASHPGRRRFFACWLAYTLGCQRLSSNLREPLLLCRIQTRIADTERNTKQATTLDLELKSMGAWENPWDLVADAAAMAEKLSKTPLPGRSMVAGAIWQRRFELTEVPSSLEDRYRLDAEILVLHRLLQALCWEEISRIVADRPPKSHIELAELSKAWIKGGIPYDFQLAEMKRIFNSQE